MPDRQAVLIIHGVGQQKPMETLYDFLDNICHEIYRKEHFWSRPDSVSGNYDLRQIVTIDESSGTRTDFFELYWAHLMEGTRLGSVWSWILFDLIGIFRSRKIENDT